MKSIFVLPHLFILILVLFQPVILNSQPSGEAYGPLKMVYKLPDVKGKIFYVSPDGKSIADGVDPEKPTTIETAISRAVTGDAIIMRGGTYRTGNLTFNQGITIQPYGDEQPVLKGTLVATKWKKEGELWSTHWEYLFPAGPESWWAWEREEKFTPLHRFNNDGVFVDGSFLQSAGSKEEVNEGTFFVDYGAKRIYIGTNPSKRLIEITAFRKAIFRTTGDCNGKKSDGIGPIIRGLTITQYPDTMVHIDGYYPQGISPEDKNGKDVIGTRFENCVFSNCFRIGLFAIGDSLVMKNCKVENTNTEGVYIVASSDVVLEKNIFANNNIEKWTGFYPAAVKIFNQTHRVIFRDNKVTDHPYSNGVWYDVGNIDGVVVNNWFEGVRSTEEPSGNNQFWSGFNAFFFEISKGAICAGNVFVNCDHGIMILNSSNVEVYNNTFVNSMAHFGRDQRGDGADHFGWHPLTGPGVEERDGHLFINNLMTVNENYSNPLVLAWQPAKLCERLNKPQIKTLDNNIFVRQSNISNAPFILWSPYSNEKCQKEIFNPEELNSLYPGFSGKNKYYNEYNGPVYKNEANKDFKLSEQFQSTEKGFVIPEKIRKAMGLMNNGDGFIGAYSK